MKHINATTGASVWLRGRGSGGKDHVGDESDEQLHLLLRSESKDCHLSNGLVSLTWLPWTQMLVHCWDGGVPRAAIQWVGKPAGVVSL